MNVTLPAYPLFIESKPIPGCPRFRITPKGDVWTYGRKGKWYKLEPYTNSEGHKSVWMNDPNSEKPVGAGGHHCGSMYTIDELLSKAYEDE